MGRGGGPQMEMICWMELVDRDSVFVLDQLIHLEKIITILAPMPYLKHKQQVSKCLWLHYKDL